MFLLKVFSLSVVYEEKLSPNIRETSKGIVAHDSKSLKGVSSLDGL
jgi:hypothetical protein